MGGLLLCLGTSVASALPATTVVIENFVGGEPEEAAVLTDADGVSALSAGTAGERDGAVVELGYFTGSGRSATFSGWWIPLAGPGSANTGIPVVSIGDTATGAAGPYGHLTGQFVFDEARPQAAQNLPVAGTRLAVAIYNGRTPESSTRFNLATHDAWRWKEPGLSPDFIYLDLNDAAIVWHGGPGSARRTSEPIASFPGLRPKARLINISTRGYVGTGNEVLIPGFVVSGTGTKRLLVRAVGPTLGREPFNVTGVLADPVLQVIRPRDQAELARNDNWGEQPDAPAVGAAMASVGAFAIPEGSRDAALLIDAPAGEPISALVSGAGGSTGVVIAEVYVVDDEAAPGGRLANISTRGIAITGDAMMIPGFVVGPGASRRLLVRAVSSVLAQPPWNLPGVIADPQIRIVLAGGSTALAENDDWERGGAAAEIAAAARQVGAFPLPAGSKDAALLFATPADAAGSGFTVQVTGAGGAAGMVLTEVYELP